MAAAVAETGQTEEGDILNRRAKHNVSRWREDPAPDKLSRGGRRGEAAVVTGRRESFSMLGTRGRQTSEENGKKVEATLPTTGSLARCGVLISSYVV